MGRAFSGSEPVGKTKLYKVWTSMKQRCVNPSDEAYENYGGRGITVCESWANDFHRFRVWAEDHGYRVGLTIDRVDNDAGYCPENCRWTDRQTQNVNKRQRERILEFNGKSGNYSFWENDLRDLGITRNTIKSRLCFGWSIEDTLTKPMLGHGKASKKGIGSKKYTFKGETGTATFWANKIGCKSSVINRRLSDGWSVEKALTHPWRKTVYGESSDKE